MIDGLMKELGLDGSSLEGLVASTAVGEPVPAPVVEEKPKVAHAENDRGEPREPEVAE